VTRTDRPALNISPLTTPSHELPLNSDPRNLTYSVVAMSARCSLLSSPATLPSVPSGIAHAQIVSLLLSVDVGVRCHTNTCLHFQNLRPTPIIHVVEPEGFRNPYPLEDGLIGMDFLPNLRVTERSIGSTPAGACSTGNYIASPRPFLEVATTNALPPTSSLLMPPTSSSSPSSQHDHIPRACHGVERRQRSRPSSRGGGDYLHFSKLTRHERAAHKAASSRRVAFTEHVQQLASSSSWTSPDDAPPSATTILTTGTGTGKFKRRPSTPRYVTSFDAACSSLDDDDDECDASPGSPGFDADVEFEPAEMAERSLEQVGDKERLTIMVPGGKSEAYVAMAFERSCSLSNEEDDDDCSSGAVDQSRDMSDTNEKTGLKIRIPVPNPLFMLSLRLASSCRLSEDEEEQSELDTGAAPAHAGDDDGRAHQSQSAMTQDQERGEGQNLLNPLPIRADGSFFASSSLSRSPTPPVAPPPSPAPLEGRAERRVARRAALAPYCAIDRLHAVRARERPCLSY
jgi:hypothetical protein